jgi:hypothetical protein
MKILTALAVAATLALAGTAAQAAVLYASSVDIYSPGTGITDPDRTVTANALGAPDGKFLSLGRGGEAVFSFGKPFRAIGAVVEITFGNRDTYIERVDLYGGLNNVFTFLGTLGNAAAVNAFSFAGTFDQLKLVDVSPAGAKRDGYDIDALHVSAVPLPASALLLLSAAGAAGAVARLRRRTA